MVGGLGACDTNMMWDRDLSLHFCRSCAMYRMLYRILCLELNDVLYCVLYRPHMYHITHRCSRMS